MAEISDDTVHLAQLCGRDGELVLEFEQGDPGQCLGVARELGFARGLDVTEGFCSALQRGERAGRPEDRCEGERRGEARVLVARRREHFGEPCKERAAAAVGQLIDRPLGILVVAFGLPGPGYLAVELAKLVRFNVTGLDISRTFVSLGRELAQRAGVTVDFRLGDATSMPFPDAQFDLIVCQAAFKNFDRPLSALDEMHRVLRPGGRAVIHDMSAEATSDAIAAEVAAMNLGRMAALTTRLILTGLRRRAYTPAQLDELVRRSTFGSGTIVPHGIGLEATLTRS